MSKFKLIRNRLGLSQSEMGAALGKTQGAVSFYENGATVPPDVASRLIEFARERGLALTFDHVYGDTELPAQPETAAQG